MSKQQDRVTIMVPEILRDRVVNHVRLLRKYDNLTDFYSQAVLNQLERDGDFDIRDIVEGEDN